MTNFRQEVISRLREKGEISWDQLTPMDEALIEINVNLMERITEERRWVIAYLAERTNSPDPAPSISEIIDDLESEWGL